jgi:hypothetical protein
MEDTDIYRHVFTAAAAFAYACQDFTRDYFALEIARKWHVMISQIFWPIIREIPTIFCRPFRQISSKLRNV